GASGRLVAGHVPASARIIGLFRVARDNAALHGDLPGARAGAIHAMRRPHDLVVRPAIAVSVLPRAILSGGSAVAVGEAFPRTGKIGEAIEKMTHRGSPLPKRRKVIMGSSHTRCDAGRTTS